MSIVKYVPEEISPDYAKVLSGINDHALRTKALLTAAGDYWSAYYRDIDPILSSQVGAVTALSKEYTRLLDLVRASNVLDVPVSDSQQFELIVLDSADFEPVWNEDQTEILHFFCAFPDVIETEYVCTSLFEAPVVLRNGVHFDIVPGEGYRFYVDLFHDDAIVEFSMTVGENSTTKIILWAVDIAFNSTVIYNRYGRFLYKKAFDRENYKWIIEALMRFYEKTKSPNYIRNVLDVMYGVPYTRFKDEKILEIYHVDSLLERADETTEEPFICIRTDKASYYTYEFSRLSYNVGDIVPQYSTLATFNVVEDYVNHPSWWEDYPFVKFPDKLLDEGMRFSREQWHELMDKVLKHNTVHVVIGVSFETYAAYQNQVREIFRIIESGIPVYLYPVIEAIFRAAFVDTVDFADLFDRMRIHTDFHSHYYWNAKNIFNGDHCYYMNPGRDHGSQSEKIDNYADGSHRYHVPLRHDGDVVNAERFDGTPCYEAPFALSHESGCEDFKVTRLWHRGEDEYPWSTAPGLEKYVHVKYNGRIVHDARYTFGAVLKETVGQLHNDLFAMWPHMRGMEDVVPMPTDGAFDVRLNPGAMEDFAQQLLFDGKRLYDGFSMDVPLNIDESFELRVIRADA